MDVFTDPKHTRSEKQNTADVTDHQRLRKGWYFVVLVWKTDAL